MCSQCSFRVAIGIAALAVAAPAAAQTPPLGRVTRLGSYKDYGPGIFAASLRKVQFETTRAAHVIVLRVHPDGSIEPLLPQIADQPTARDAGAHVIEAPEPAVPEAGGTRLLDPVLSREGLERSGRRVMPPAAGVDERAPKPTSYWWLVVVADAPIGIEALAATLESFANRTFSSVQAEVRALPRDLMAKRTERWAAYFVHVDP